MILYLKIFTIIMKKIKFTIETNPKKFADSRLLLENDIIKLKFTTKPINSPYTGNRKFQKDTKEMQQMETYIVHGESAQFFIMRKIK